MLSKEEIKEWLLENCVNEMGILDLSGLDFSDFDGYVCIGGMKVKNSLNQSFQEVGGYLYQHNQKVAKNLYQNCQQVGGDLIPEDLLERSLKAKAKIEAEIQCYTKEIERKRSYRQGRETAFEEAEAMVDEMAKKMKRRMELAKKKEKKQ